MMSSLQRNRRFSAPRDVKYRRRRAKSKKSLKFDDPELSIERDAAPPNQGFQFTQIQNPTEGQPILLDSFWSSPPPPPPKFENRRSTRLHAKTQFPISQIADRFSPQSQRTNATSDKVLWRKNHDAQLQTSDYGTSSECSALYFQPSHSSCSSTMNTKLCFDSVARYKSNRMVQTAVDTGNHSIGYSSDLDEVMSNLSIDETTGMNESRRWDSEEEFPDESEARDSHLSLEDFKIGNLKAILKMHGNISMLIPLQGYEISHIPKCMGRRRSLSFNEESRSKPRKAFRYDLRKRPGGPQLENMLTIETFEDISIEEDFLKAGLRIFQVSPIISIQPHAVKFCNLCPAIVQIPLNLDPSSGDEVHCLFSRSSVEELITNLSSLSWSSEMAGKFCIKDGKVVFETFQFGIFVLVIRPKSPYSSSMKNIRARVGGKLVVSGFPQVEVSFPKEVTDLDILKANAKIYFDTEESVSEFVLHRLPVRRAGWDENKVGLDCLATPIIQLEPHGINFEGEPVMITLPVPHYDQIVSLLGCKAKLSIWQSNTHSSEPSNWEKLDVEYQVSQFRSHGESMTVVTFPVTHFSFFKGVWEAISEYLYDAKIGMLYYFVSFAMKCQAHMQEYPDSTPSTSKATKNEEDDDTDSAQDKESKPIKGGSRFGLEVIVFQADKPWPQMSTYKYKVGQSNPKLVKPGKIFVRLKSHYFEPDIQAGEEEEMVKEESDFRGRDFEKQFICKFKPDVNIERGPFGKVLVHRQVSPRQKGQPIFEFNIQKHGNEGDIEDPSSKQNEEWSMVALTELANSLFVTEGDNWKMFASEIGMTKQEIKDARLKSDSQPFQKIVSHYRQRGGTAQELVDALYKCHRTLKVGGQYSGQGSNNTRSSNGSSGRGSLSSNNAHASRIGSHDSDTSGTQTTHSQDSGLPAGRKRSQNSSFRGSGGGVASVHSNTSKLSKRRRLSYEPGPSRRVNPADADIDTSSDSDVRASVKSDIIFRNDRSILSNKFLWKLSDKLNNGNWKALGRTLGLDESVLIDVDHAHNNTGFRECLYQMLLGWKQRFPKKCDYGSLYSALQKEGLLQAAKAMEDITTDSEQP